jgi:NADPH-dependent ferric siderophore reductase
MVTRVERLTERMMRVRFSGASLADLNVQPAASVRLLLPETGSAVPTAPVWNGNEFLLPDGSRPAIRTFTPRRIHPVTGELDLEIVLHSGGVASRWARTVQSGGRAALSGPGRGYEIDEAASGFVLAGDETALPAIGRILEVLPAAASVLVYVEVAHPDARQMLPAHPQARIEWVDLPVERQPGEALFSAVGSAEIPPAARVWCAGEAASMQRLRRYFFGELGIPRANATVRGYWKHGRHGS